MPRLLESNVTLVQTPSADNGWFYIVRGVNGNYYVSALGGKVAENAAIGSKFNLMYDSTHSMGYYVLHKDGT